MNKIYTRINWENYPSEATALNETNLNKMDFALNEVDNRLIEQDTTKLSKVDATNDIVDWNMDETTGIITITRRSGEQIIFDLNIEKIPVSFTLSDDGILTMVTDDGTEFTANIGAMIPVLTFNDSDEISVSVSGTGINKTYSFSIKTGSVTEDKLQPNFLADIKVESANALASANNASISATNSANSAIESESFAVGGTGTRTGEDTDNAKYYNEKAQEALSKIQSAQVTGVKGNNETEYRKGEVNLTAENIGALNIGGDVAENTVAFTSNDAGPDGTPALISLEKLTTGEKLSTLMNKVSIIANNFRYFLKMLGNNDISSIGDGTVTGAIRTLNDNLLDKTYPVGSIYMSVKNINPSTLFGGTWVEWGSGRVPVGVNTSDSNFKTVEKTGGASTVTLTTAQLPSHSHGSVPIHTSGIETKGYGLSTTNYFQDRVAIAEVNSGENFKTGSTGSGSAHNNLQPYITCYMWKRTA